jgi:hypothetical protein
MMFPLGPTSALNHRPARHDRKGPMADALIHRNAGPSFYGIYFTEKPESKIDDQLAATDR